MTTHNKAASPGQGFEAAHQTHHTANRSDPTPEAQAPGKIRFDISAALAGIALGLTASIIAISAVVIAVAVVKGLLP